MRDSKDSGGEPRTERALTLQEVADQMGLSYRTIFNRRKEIGFQLPGGRAWRVWPSTLAEFDQKRNNLDASLLRTSGENVCLSAKTKIPVFGKLASQRQAAEELERLLAPQTKSRRRNTTTG